MDVVPSAKRRRLNEITNQSPARTTLSKPFKSPLKRSFVAAENARDYFSVQNDVDIPASENNTAPKPPNAVDISSSEKALTVPQRRSPNVQATLPTTHSSTSISTTTTTPPTTSLGPMALTTRIRSLRSDIDALTQATKLLSSLPTPNPAIATSSINANNRPPPPPRRPSSLPIPEPDRQLLILAERWQTTARAAAEDVYASTRDRVNRMGGVGAWRQREREGRERRAEWEREANAVPMMAADVDDDDDDDESEDGDDEDDGAKSADGPTALERREARRMQRDAADWSCAAEPEVESGADTKESTVDTMAESAGGADDDEFSMGMMLKTLGVDAAILGYSETELSAS